MEGDEHEEGEFECQELNSGGGICGDKLHPCGGPSALCNHHRGKHKAVYMALKGYLSDAAGAAVVLDAGVSLFDAGQATIQAQPFSEARKEECDMACARCPVWLVKSARPITLPEIDKPFGVFIRALTRGAWVPPNRRNVMDCILHLSANGQLQFRNWYEAMVWPVRSSLRWQATFGRMVAARS